MLAGEPAGAPVALEDLREAVEDGRLDGVAFRVVVRKVDGHTGRIEELP